MEIVPEIFTTASDLVVYAPSNNPLCHMTCGSGSEFTPVVSAVPLEAEEQAGSKFTQHNQFTLECNT